MEWRARQDEKEGEIAKKFAPKVPKQRGATSWERYCEQHGLDPNGTRFYKRVKQ